MSKLDRGIAMKWQHTIVKWVYKEVDPGINKLKCHFKKKKKKESYELYSSPICKCCNLCDSMKMKRVAF